MPFVKIIELGTLYSTIDDVENAANVQCHLNDVISSLQFVLYLMTHRPGCLPGISGPSFFVRLVALFLCPPDISHNARLTKMLGPILKLALEKTSVVHNTVIPIADIPSFTDYFMRLCDAFEGHGYSLKIFSAALLVPMIHSAELRLIVWGDRQPMLRMMVNDLTELILPFQGTVFSILDNLK